MLTRRHFLGTATLASLGIPVAFATEFNLPVYTEINLGKLLQPVKKHSVLSSPDWNIWGGNMVRTPDGICHHLFARWPKEAGFNAWVTHSEIAYATSDSPTGPYHIQECILPRRQGFWDADATHNPMMLKFDGKYYLYYTGNYGNGEWWDHRNHQRTGVAVADHPAGPWKRFDKPIIDVSPGSWDHLIANCPVVTRNNKGKYFMIYKGVSEGKMPFGGKVRMGVATADNPLGPWKKEAVNPFDHPGSHFPTDDNVIWFANDQFYAIVKDYRGLFSGTGKPTLVLFQSLDGLKWELARDFMVSTFDVKWEDGTVTEDVHRLDQPQLYFEDGKPKALFLAVKEKPDTVNTDLSYNIQLALNG